MLTIFSAIVFIISVICLAHWRHQPLSTDDGNWLYDSEFGVNLSYQKFDALGVFFILKLFRKIYPIKEPNATYHLKAIWFSLLNSAIFILCQLVFGDYLISFLAVFIHLYFQMNPLVGYYYTYGENFLLLPLMIGVIFTYYAYSFDLNILYFVSGLFFGYAFVIKIVALIILAPFLVLSIFFFDIYALLCVLAGFIVSTFFRVLFIKGFKNKIESIVSQCKNLFLTAVICLRAAIPILPKLHKAETPLTNYVNKNYQKKASDLWKECSREIIPIINTNKYLCILAVATIIYYTICFDFYVCLFSLLLILCIAIPLVEKLIIIGHSTQIWLGVSILSAIGIRQIISSENVFIYIVLGLLFCVDAIKPISHIYHKLKNPKYFFPNISDIPHTNKQYNKIMIECRNIGEDIKKLSNDKDYLLVWGNTPTIHLYAHRRALDKRRFFLYLNGKILMSPEAEELLFRMIKSVPPKYLLFFKNHIKDNITIDTISQRAKVPYKYVKTYQVTDYNGNVIYNEPLYEIDSILFAEMLFDRYLNNFYADFERDYLSEMSEVNPITSDGMLIDRLSSYLPKAEIEQLFTPSLYKGKEIEITSEMISYINIFNLIKENQLPLAETKLMDLTDIKYFGLFYLALGELSFLKNDLDGAKTYLSKSIEINPYIGTAWNDLGVVYCQIGTQQDAIKCFDRAIELLPNYTDAINNRKAICPK